MILVWGTHVRKAKVGYVAELCAGCRCATQHGFAEIIHASHVWWVPTERGTVVGYAAICEECGHDTEVSPDRYVAMSRRRAAVHVLQQATHPGLAAEIAELADREKRAHRGELSPSERLVAMQEALVGLEEKATKRAARVHFDVRSTAFLLGVLTLPWYLMIEGTMRDGALGNAIFYLGFAALCGLVVGMFHSFATDTSRFIRRRLATGLRERLAPFHASPAEIAHLVESLKASDWTLGVKLDAEWLTQQLYAQDAVSS
jgi:hypothetical protein